MKFSLAALSLAVFSVAGASANSYPCADVCDWNAGQEPGVDRYPYNCNTELEGIHYFYCQEGVGNEGCIYKNIEDGVDFEREGYCLFLTKDLPPTTASPTGAPTTAPTGSPVATPITASPTGGPTAAPTSSPVAVTPAPTDGGDCDMNGSDTAFGYPISYTQGQEMSILDFAGRWGWFLQIDAFTGAEVVGFQMWAGAAKNDFTKGTYLGDVTVSVAVCDTQGMSDWSEFGSGDICTDVNEDDGRHVHVGTSLPEGKNGPSFAPGQFEQNCCVVGEPCYVIVHAAVDNYHESSCSKCSEYPTLGLF